MNRSSISDGIIKEDRLGLQSNLHASKALGGNRRTATIQQVAVALQGHRGRKGVVLTTSNFSREAMDYAKSLQTTIVLIDGVQLVDYMIEFRVFMLLWP